MGCVLQKRFHTREYTDGGIGSTFAKLQKDGIQRPLYRAVECDRKFGAARIEK